MPQMRTGVFPDGPNKGRRWEVYQDARSPTGWVRKIFDPYRPGVEYFENFNAAAADVDEMNQAAQQQQIAAQQRQQADAVQQAQRSQSAYWDRIGNEDARRWDTTDQRAERESQSAIQERQERLKLAQRQFDENRRQFDVTSGQDSARLGLDVLKTSASLRGPEDVFQGFAFANGAAGMGLGSYVDSLYTNGASYGGGTASGGSPAPLTLGSLARSVGAGGGGGGSGNGAATDQYGRTGLTQQQAAYLRPIKDAYEGGLANKGLGYLENMTDGQRAAMRSGGSYLGRDVAAEEEYYKRSRPGQRSALRG